MKVIFKSSIRHVFINQHPLSSGDAIPDERHQVSVVHAADDIDLRLKLSLPLPAISFQALDSDLLPVGQHPLVHVPEPALPEQVRLREPTGGGSQVVVGEATLVEAEGHGWVGWGQGRLVRAGESARTQLAAA